MRSHLRELLREAKKLGFKFDGYDGRGHPRLIHDTGRRLSVSHTPSDVHASKNALAQMRRITREEGDNMSTTTVTQEAWKTLIGLPAFELSNAGRFRKRLTGKIIQPIGHGAGLTVRLSDDKGRVHEKNVRKTVQTHFGCNPVLVVEDNLTATIGERMKVRELANPISHQPAEGDGEMRFNRSEALTQGEEVTIQAETLGIPVEHVGLPRHTVDIPEVEFDHKEPVIPPWADVIHEGVAEGYELSDHGEVLSPTGAVLKSWVTSDNIWVSVRRSGPTSKPYLQIRLDLLMVEAFHGPQPGPDYGPEHINKDASDCSAANLRWTAGYAIPVGAHRGKHRFEGHLLTDEQIQDRKASRQERKRARDRKRYYDKKAEREARKAVPQNKTKRTLSDWIEETQAADTPADEVEVSRVTSYRYRGIEVIVDQDGNFQAPEMTLQNAADLAKILAKVAEKN